MSARGQSVKSYTIEDIPNVQLINKLAFVSDPEHAVEPMYVDSLNSYLAHLRDSLGIQCAVVVVPAVEGDDAVYFAYRLFNYWGIGDKDRDDGLLLLLLTGDDHREIKFETGYGLEGSLTDAICKRIQTQAMLPYLREQNWGAGLLAGVRAVYGVLTKDPAVVAFYTSPDTDQVYSRLSKKDIITFACLLFLWFLIGCYYIYHPIFKAKKRHEKGSETDFMVFQTYPEKKRKTGCGFAILFLPVIMFIYLAGYFIISKLRKRASTCPVCGAKMNMGFVVLKKATANEHGQIKDSVTCPQCKHEESYTWDTPFGYDPYYIDNRVSSERSSGGSSSGGSWGGGSSGGGGASTRF